jgi:erythromycin esterase
MKSYQKALAKILFLLAISLVIYKFLIIDFLYPINQNLVKFVSNHTIEIINIDPAEPNISGFDQIANAIGDSRVVFLGEQDHGEAPAFLAKTKLIKYLHQNQGFDVIIFESDFFALNFNDSDSLIGFRSDYQNNIYSIWSKCLECQNLFEYINDSKSKENPILVAGVDPRHSMINSQNFFLPSFMEYMNSENLFESKDEEETVRKVLIELLDKEYDSKIKEMDKGAFLNFLERAEAQLADSLFWHQEIRNLRGYFFNSFSDSNNERDVQMSDNLLWLLEHPFHNRKVIFWGSNSHIFKDFSTILEKYGTYTSDQDTTNMGSEVAKRLGDDLYILGFTSFGGEGGRLYQQGYKIGKPNPNHFEALIHEMDYAFVDFRKNKKELDKTGHFWMKTLIHQPNYYAWHKMFDGIFYIKDTYRCTEISENGKTKIQQD